MTTNRIPDYCFWCGDAVSDGDEICQKCINEAVWGPQQHPPLDAPDAYDFGEFICPHCDGLIRNPLAPCIHCGKLGNE